MNCSGRIRRSPCGCRLRTPPPGNSRAAIAGNGETAISLRISRFGPARSNCGAQKRRNSCGDIAAPSARRSKNLVACVSPFHRQLDRCEAERRTSTTRRAETVPTVVEAADAPHGHHPPELHASHRPRAPASSCGVREVRRTARSDGPKRGRDSSDSPRDDGGGGLGRQSRLSRTSVPFRYRPARASRAGLKGFQPEPRVDVGLLFWTPLELPYREPRGQGGAKPLPAVSGGATLSGMDPKPNRQPCGPHMDPKSSIDLTVAGRGNRQNVVK